MNLKNVKISTQLYLGLGLILVVVLAMSFLSWWQMEAVWGRMRALYDHSFQVYQGLDEIEENIFRVRIEMRNYFLSADDRDRERAAQNIAVLDARIERRFEHFSQYYTGSKADIDGAFEAFIRWRRLRQDNLNLARTGKNGEALQGIGPSGDVGMVGDQLLGHIWKIDEITRKAKERLYLEAEALKNALYVQMVVIIAGVLVLLAVVSTTLLRGIQTPLRQLGIVVEARRRGRLDARWAYASGNEFGLLATAFNAMADTIETQMCINDHAAQLTGVMLRENDARSFCRELLKVLIDHTGSQMGAVYLLNPAIDAFEHFESVGLSAAAHAAFSAGDWEGEFGVALSMKQMRRIANIPEKTRFIFAAVSGDVLPCEIITMPLLVKDEVVAMISLASIHSYAPMAIRLLETVQDTITARMNGVLTYRQIQDLAGRLEAQNRELEAQKQQLTDQSQALTRMNAELEAQKQQLDQASRAKSDFLSSMSHELRTPLNSVIALSDVLNRRLAGKIPEEEAGYLAVIARNGRQLLGMINNILDFSRIEAGREDVVLEPVFLHRLVEEVAAMFEVQAREKGIDLMRHVADDLPPVQTDADKVRHVLQNLVGNAVKFTGAGSVTISARQAGEEVHVVVRDTGIGIAADEVPHLFEAFYQADQSASRRYGGVGLGLAIAGRYAAMLHGRILVESAPGRGSTFTLVLPQALSTRKPVALVVEDNGDSREVMRIMLEETYVVLEAGDGLEGIALAQRHRPDVILMDIALPRMDGFEVLAALRDDPALRHIPVVAVTARALAGDREDMLARGFDEYIAKPVEAAKVRTILRKVLHGTE